MTTQTDRIAGLNQGLAIKAPCVVAATTNVALTGLQTIGSVTLAANDRVLLTGQTAASENGIYDAASGAWTRSADFNGAWDAVRGTLVPVAQGSNSLAFYRVATASGFTIGTTALTFQSVGVNALGNTFVDFSDYNPVADGVTSDYDAFVDALQAADGGTLVLGRNQTYAIDQQITFDDYITKGVTILGQNSILKAVSSFTGNNVISGTTLLTDDGVEDVFIRNLDINGNSLAVPIFGAWKNGAMEFVRVRGGPSYQANAKFEQCHHKIYLQGDSSQNNNGWDCVMKGGSVQFLEASMGGNQTESLIWFNNSESVKVTLPDILNQDFTILGAENCRDMDFYCGRMHIDSALNNNVAISTFTATLQSDTTVTGDGTDEVVVSFLLAHGRQVGEHVLIESATDTDANGAYRITAVTELTYTFTAGGNVSSGVDATALVYHPCESITLHTPDIRGPSLTKGYGININDVIGMDVIGGKIDRCLNGVIFPAVTDYSKQISLVGVDLSGEMGNTINAAGNIDGKLTTRGCANFPDIMPAQTISDNSTTPIIRSNVVIMSNTSSTTITSFRVDPNNRIREGFPFTIKFTNANTTLQHGTGIPGTRLNGATNTTPGANDVLSFVYSGGQTQQVAPVSSN